MNDQCQAFDAVETSSKLRIDAQGFIHVTGVLARPGIQLYRAAEVTNGDGEMMFPEKNPNDMVRLYRSRDTLAEQACIDSFTDKPICLGHPPRDKYPRGVTKENWKSLARGHVNDVKCTDKLRGNLHITEDGAVEHVKAKLKAGQKPQLSNGYNYIIDPTPGISEDGESFDGEQKVIRGNHLAIVDTARGGEECSIDDSNKGQATMSKETLKVYGIDYAVEDATIATLIRKLVATADDAAAELATRTTAHAAAVTKMAADHKTELDSLRLQVVGADQITAMVTDRSDVLAAAVKLCPELKIEGSTSAIRRGMIGDMAGKNAVVKGVTDAVLAGVSLDKAPDAVVLLAYNAAVASVQVAAGDEAAKRSKAAHAFAQPLGIESKKTPTVAADAADVPDFSEETRSREMCKPVAGASGN